MLFRDGEAVASARWWKRVTRSVRGPLSALSPNANEGVSRIRAGWEAVNSCALTLATCLLASPVYFISQSVNRKTLRRPASPRHRSVATSTYVSRYSPCLYTATRHAASVPAKLMALSPERIGIVRDGMNQRRSKIQGQTSPGFSFRFAPPGFPAFSSCIFPIPGIPEVSGSLLRSITLNSGFFPVLFRFPISPLIPVFWLCECFWVFRIFSNRSTFRSGEIYRTFRALYTFPIFHAVRLG